jgi:hypothetical protein
MIRRAADTYLRVDPPAVRVIEAGPARPSAVVVSVERPQLPDRPATGLELGARWGDRPQEERPADLPILD